LVEARYPNGGRMIDVLGYFGAACLALCGVPLLLPNRKFGDLVFLWAWLIGELTMLAYVLLDTRDAPLVLNYGVNALLVIAVLYRRRDR
jgi:hypothetical protein